MKALPSRAGRNLHFFASGWGFPPRPGAPFSSSFAPEPALYNIRSSTDLYRRPVMRGHKPPWSPLRRRGTRSQQQSRAHCFLCLPSNCGEPSLAPFLFTSHGPFCSCGPRTWDLWGTFSSAGMSPLGFTSRVLLPTTPLFLGSRSSVGIWRLRSELLRSVWLGCEERPAGSVIWSDP